MQKSPAKDSGIEWAQKCRFLAVKENARSFAQTNDWRFIQCMKFVDSRLTSLPFVFTILICVQIMWINIEGD